MSTNDKDIKKFLELRDSLWSEMERLERQMADLSEEWQAADKRHTQLQQILDGSPQGLELLEGDVTVTQRGTSNKTTVSADMAFDHAVIEFLTENQGSSKREIVEALTDSFGPDVPYQLDKSIKRLKRRGVVFREGTTRNATWRVV